MKSLIMRKPSKAERQAARALIDDEIKAAYAKSQALFLVAMHEALGISAQRGMKVIDAFSEVCEEYEGFRRDDVADEILLRKLKEIGYDYDDTIYLIGGE